MSLRKRKSLGRAEELNSVTPVVNSCQSSSTTLIIVPDSLIDHWMFQIDSHIASGVHMRIFVDTDISMPLPSAEILCTYHVLLITHRY